MPGRSPRRPSPHPSAPRQRSTSSTPRASSRSPGPPNIGPARPGSPSAIAASTYLVLHWEYQTFPPHSLTIWHFVIGATFDIERGNVKGDAAKQQLRRVKRRLRLMRGVYTGDYNGDIINSNLAALDRLEDALDPATSLAHRSAVIAEVRQLAASAYDRAIAASVSQVSWMILS